ncbi:hypothetical protein FRC0547_02190 [Corynebacterium diphtheriae]|nr:hypothetical protein FRC0515_02126 [Corynebacterium diphtheriae]CAB1049023.1 hypothetical protein FRC0547_02190 [Corynebacterium diphtheriae]
MPQPQQKLRRSPKSLTRSTPRASCPKSPKISKKPLIPKNTKSSRLKPKSCSKKKQTKTKDQETRVNAAEPAHQKEYDKLTEQAKHETKEEARRQTEFKKEREKQKQKTKHASNAKKPSTTGSSTSRATRKRLLRRRLHRRHLGHRHRCAHSHEHRHHCQRLPQRQRPAALLIPRTGQAA